jgi:hypothetical protein
LESIPGLHKSFKSTASVRFTSIQLVFFASTLPISGISRVRSALKDRSGANSVYSINGTDRSEAKSVYSTNLKERSGVNSVYSTNWTDRSEAKSVYSTNSKNRSGANTASSRNRQDRSKKTNWIEVKRTEEVLLKLLWSPGINSKELIPPPYAQADLYNNPFPARFLAPLDCSKAP